MAKKRNNRTRHMMYTQQIKHLPSGKTADEIIDEIENVLAPERFGAIVHDKDENEDGTPKEPHLHVMMSFKNPRSVEGIAKQLNERPQYFERFNKSSENGYAYLCHRTTQSRHKHQYNPDEVKANFNYTESINTATKKVTEIENYASSNKTKAILNLVFTGDMTLKEAISKLNGVEYASIKRKLHDVHELYLQNEAATFHEQMKAENRTVKTSFCKRALQHASTRRHAGYQRRGGRRADKGS